VKAEWISDSGKRPVIKPDRSILFEWMMAIDSRQFAVLFPEEPVTVNSL
jgi:hypothetical protein